MAALAARLAENVTGVVALADAAADDKFNYWGSPFEFGDDLTDNQLLFVTVIYALLLYQASNLISDGSEFLLLVPSLAGIVGSIVLPILGAVPDGMMTLCSGLGPNAQDSVSAGVGVLAGSTIMLLTFPWFIAVVYGRVPINEQGEAVYEKKLIGVGPGKYNGNGMFTSGIGPSVAIKKNAYFMLGTTLIYLVIQIPAYGEDYHNPPLTTETQAAHERSMALVGGVVSVMAFFGYLYMCNADEEGKEDTAVEFIIQAVQDKKIGLGAALVFAKKSAQTMGSLRFETESDENKKKLQRIMRPFFHKYDDNGDNQLSKIEFRHILEDLGEKLCDAEKDKMFRDTDVSRDGLIQFNEFVNCLYEYLSDNSRFDAMLVQTGNNVANGADEAGEDDEEEDDEDETEEVPEDIRDLPEDQQQRIILWRAGWMMALGSAIVLSTSDPFVDCLTEWGKRLNVSPFYVAFVAAPFASNASELIAAYNYAKKKTKSSITNSLSTLVGAGCMNNTFCLGIFFALIYFKGLAWKFTAETVATILIQWVIGIAAIKLKVQTLATGWLILACYPACLFIVYFLENVLHFD